MMAMAMVNGVYLDLLLLLLHVVRVHGGNAGQQRVRLSLFLIVLMVFGSDLNRT